MAEISVEYEVLVGVEVIDGEVVSVTVYLEDFTSSEPLQVWLRDEDEYAGKDDPRWSESVRVADRVVCSGLQVAFRLQDEGESR